jgi:hypothetical protein
MMMRGSTNIKYIYSPNAFSAIFYPDMPSCPFIADTNYSEYNDIGNTALDYEM